MLCRPPAAFALFLKSQKGKLNKVKRVRYTKKTTVFRFDLLKLRFASLMQADRDVYIEASARASDELARVRSSAVDESKTGHTAVLATAGADAVSSAIAGVGPRQCLASRHRSWPATPHPRPRGPMQCPLTSLPTGQFVPQTDPPHVRVLRLLWHR